MAYKRKTVDAWEMFGNYGQGWEMLCSGYTREELKQNRKDYNENEPGTPRKTVWKRERIVGNG
jgi:hypothetical protein